MPNCVLHVPAETRTGLTASAVSRLVVRLWNTAYPGQSVQGITLSPVTILMLAAFDCFTLSR